MYTKFKIQSKINEVAAQTPSIHLQVNFLQRIIIVEYYAPRPMR